MNLTKNTDKEMNSIICKGCDEHRTVFEIKTIQNLHNKEAHKKVDNLFKLVTNTRLKFHTRESKATKGLEQKVQNLTLANMHKWARNKSKSYWSLCFSQTSSILGPCSKFADEFKKDCIPRAAVQGYMYPSFLVTSSIFNWKLLAWFPSGSICHFIFYYVFKSFKLC